MSELHYVSFLCIGCSLALHVSSRQSHTERQCVSGAKRYLKHIAMGFGLGIHGPQGVLLFI